jgi:hypothetical protein
VARLMRQIRSDTADLHDPGGGDNSWSLGCRAFARTVFALRQAVADHVWLTVVKEGSYLQFTFAIGGVPIRFYHGEADDAPSKYLGVTFGELRQWRLSFAEDDPRDEVLRIAIETDLNGMPSAITLVEVGRDGKPRDSYVIPADDGKVVQFQPKGIDLPRPSVTPMETEERREAKRKRERDAG